MKYMIPITSEIHGQHHLDQYEFHESQYKLYR